MIKKVFIIVLIAQYFIGCTHRYKHGYEVLFDDSNTSYYTNQRLSDSEKEQIFNFLNLKLSEGQEGFEVNLSKEEIKEFDIIMTDVIPFVRIIDLNNDGGVEVLVNLNNNYHYGNSGREYIFSKNSNNEYYILSEYIDEAVIVNFSENTFPDLIQDKSVIYFTLLKWNGESYEEVDNVESSFSTITFEEFYQKQKEFNLKNK